MITFKDYVKEQHDIDYKDDGRYIFSGSKTWNPRDKSGLMLIDLKPGPYAVWYGIGKQWLQWMSFNKPDWIDNYNAVFEIQVDDVLLLDTPDKVDHFDEMAGVKDKGHEMINWNLVATQYKGVEFNPYFHSLKFNFMWYSGIDIASGVIFDPVNGITDAKLVWSRS